MKIRVLTVLSLSAFLLLVGCRGAANTNTANGNMTMNGNMTANSTTASAADSAAKNAVEAALKSKGFNDVTVEATSTEVTIRGTIPKGRMGEVNQVAQETGKRKVNNQVIEK